MPEPKRTVVQSSAAATHAEFTFGLQSLTVSTKKQQEAVLAAGGLLFDTYLEAEDFCEAAMYPPGHEGIIPAARGRFADLRIGGLRVYVPVRAVVG